MKNVALPVLRIEIAHKDGVLVLDPNKAAVMSVHEPDKILDLVPISNEILSFISGKPGLIYRTLGYQIVLTPEETLRLMQCNLERSEYAALKLLFGTQLFEIHEDFYDPDTGEALQPRC